MSEPGPSGERLDSVALPAGLKSNEVRLIFTGIPGCGKAGLINKIRLAREEPSVEMLSPTAARSVKLDYHRLSFIIYDFDAEDLESSRLQMIAKSNTTVIAFTINLGQFLGATAATASQASTNVLKSLDRLKVLAPTNQQRSKKFHGACILLFDGVEAFRERLLYVPFKVTADQAADRAAPYNVDYDGPELVLGDSGGQLNRRVYETDGTDDEFEAVYKAAVKYIVDKHRKALQIESKSREFSHVLSKDQSPTSILRSIYKDCKEYILFKDLEYGGFLEKQNYVLCSCFSC